MRFYYRNTDHPRRLAKALRKELGVLGIKLRPTDAQDLFARMFGYADWRELVHWTGKEPPSRPDAESPSDIVAARRKQCLGVLSETVPLDVAERMLDRLMAPHGKARASSYRYLIWQKYETIEFAQLEKIVYRVAPVMDGAEVAGYSVAYRLMEQDDDDNTLTDFGELFASMEEGKNEAEWSALQDDLEFQPLGPEISSVPIRTPWGTPLALHDLGEGVMRLFGDGMGFRVMPTIMERFPEILHCRRDEAGIGWFHANHRTLVVLSLPDYFGPELRRLAELDLPRSFPMVQRVLNGAHSRTAAALARREIVEAVSDGDRERERQSGMLVPATLRRSA